MTGWQQELLEQARVGHLATVDGDGQPHVLPVCFVYLDATIYTPIDEKPKRTDPGRLKRVRNILADPRAALVVDRWREDWTQLAWLQVRGHASLCEDGQARQRAFAALRQKYPQYDLMDLESRPLIRLAPERVRSWRAAPAT